MKQELVKVKRRDLANNNNPNWKGDKLHTRICVNCGKHTRKESKSKRPIWYFKDRNNKSSGYICYNCYQSAYRKSHFKEIKIYQQNWRLRNK